MRKPGRRPPRGVYRFRESSRLLRDWAAAPAFTFTPAASTTMRSGSNVALAWRSDPSAATCALHRGVVKGVWPPPLVTGLALPADTLPDVPTPPTLYFYRAAGTSCSGTEGP